MRILWLGAALVIGGGSGSAQVVTADGLRWMAGCWELRAGERTVEEHWMAPVGGLMLGMSRTTVAGVVREYEHSAIRAADGRLVFRAAPSGQEGAEFISTEVARDSVVFSNPAHDFPQRIAYRRAAAGDSLVATIAGGPGSGPPVAFRYARVACPGTG